MLVKALRYKPKHALVSLGLHDALRILERYEKRYGTLATLNIVTVRGAKGFVEVDKKVVGENMLLHNFWALFIGLLFDQNVGFTIVNGTRDTLRTSGDVNYRPAQVCVGDNDYPVSFDQYNLLGSVSCTDATITVAVDSESKLSRVTISAPSPKDGVETGVRQALIETGGSNYYTMLSRRIVSISMNQTVVHRWNFYEPWLYNWASIMCGILRNENIAMKDISGSSLTARTSAEFNASGARIVISQNSISFDPEMYNIPNMVEIDTHYNVWSTQQYVIGHILGIYVPDTDIDIYTVGLVQKVYDTEGYTYDVLQAALPLSTPIHMKAGRPNMILWRIVAF